LRSRLISKSVVAALALTLAFASAADAAKTTKYKGKTSQGKAIKFSIKGSSLKSLTFSITLNCSDGSTLTDTESGFQATKVKKNKFSDDQVGSTDEVVLKGKRKSKGKKVTGTIKVTDKLSSSVSCGPQTVKFSVKKSK
jgi:hypothetical protein